VSVVESAGLLAVWSVADRTLDAAISISSSGIAATIIAVVFLFATFALVLVSPGAIPQERGANAPHAFLGLRNDSTIRKRPPPGFHRRL
jgi:hypothetical protein